MPAKLIICNIPSANTQAALHFYSTLMGSDAFARSLSANVEAYHMPISIDGIDLNVTARSRADEPITCFFAVDSLTTTLQQLESLGARVVVQPFALPIADQAMGYYQSISQRMNPGQPVTGSTGQMALIRDPDFNLVGLMELESHVHDHFKWGAFRNHLDESTLQHHITALQAGAKVMQAGGRPAVLPGRIFG